MLLEIASSNHSGQGKPGSLDSNNNPRDRKMCPLNFCAIHYKIAPRRFARSSAWSWSTGSRFTSLQTVIHILFFLCSTESWASAYKRRTTQTEWRCFWSERLLCWREELLRERWLQVRVPHPTWTSTVFVETNSTGSVHRVGWISTNQCYLSVLNKRWGLHNHGVWGDL